MKESLDKAREEAKRADHLIYVSLKYTRTVDVIISTIDRLLNAFGFAIDSLLKYSEGKKKIEEFPTNVGLKVSTLESAFKNDKQIIDGLYLYSLMRRIRRSKYTKKEEYRRHVAMLAEIDGGIVEIGIDKLNEYFSKTKEFIELVHSRVHEND